MTGFVRIVHDVINEHDGKLFYPGSPELIARLLRPGDTLACCERHPEDQPILRRLFRRNPAVAVHARDGYEAITALLPPKTARRGLVLMDPPFEQRDEFAALSHAIITARQRFPTGVMAVWYPIKHRTPVRTFFNTLKDAGQHKLLALEFTLRPPLDPTRLNGCGLLIANPPFQLDEEAAAVLTVLRQYLGTEDTETSVQWVVPE